MSHCRRCGHRPATIGRVVWGMDYLRLLCRECYDIETNE